MADHAEIFGIKHVRAALVFLYRKIFPRPFFFHQTVIPAAGMGAGCAVGVPNRHKIAHQTPAGIRDTHGSVNKSFDLHIFRNLAAKFPQFLKRHLSGRHDTGYAHVIPELRSHIIRRIRLCAQMEYSIRQNFPKYGDHTWIGYEKSVDFQISDPSEKIRKKTNIFIMSEDIYRHIDLFSSFVSVFRSLTDFFLCKIAGAGPQTESFAPEIDGIGSVIYRDFQFFQIAGRRQQFHFFHRYFILCFPRRSPFDRSPLCSEQFRLRRRKPTSPQHPTP